MMGERTQFFVTLPSNSSMEKFEDNTLSNYRVELNNDLHLPGGQWEVALSEIQFPMTWYNVKDSLRNYIEINKEKFYVSPGFYESAEELINALNIRFKEHGQNKLKLEYDRISKRVITTNNDVTPTTVVYGGDIARILGNVDTYQTHLESGESSNSLYLATSSAGFHAMYIYSNVVEPVYVGDVSARLLRVVPIQGQHGDYKSIAFDRPHYKPVGLVGGRVIEIKICDDTGKKIEFESGKVVVTLHFKRSKLQIF